jgi:ligand-binding sensor domain-containing protein
MATETGPPKLYRRPDPALSVHGVIEDENGGLLIALRTGIMRLMDGKVEAYSLPGGVPQVNPGMMLRDRNGGLWIGTDRGLLHVRAFRPDRSVRCGMLRRLTAAFSACSARKPQESRKKGG